MGVAFRKPVWWIACLIFGRRSDSLSLGDTPFYDIQLKNVKVSGKQRKYIRRTSSAGAKLESKVETRGRIEEARTQYKC